MSIDRNYNFKLKEIRERKGLSQEQVASQLSSKTGTVYTRSQISHYETGKNQPRLELIPVFMDILNVSAEALLGLPEYATKDDLVQLDITTSTGIKRKDITSISKQELKDALAEMYDLADKLVQENLRLKDAVLRLGSVFSKESK